MAAAVKKPDRAAAIRKMLRECGFATLDAMLIGTYATQFSGVRPKEVSTHDPALLTAAEGDHRPRPRVDLAPQRDARRGGGRAPTEVPGACRDSAAA